MEKNAGEGKKIILKHNPTIVFLDIQMPGKNGFELLKGLSDYFFQLIFVTCHDEYGVQAVKFSALDYLLKPVNVIELKKAVDKAIKRSAVLQPNYYLQNLIDLQKEQNRESHRISLATFKNKRFIHIKSIVRCESINVYTKFFMVNGEKIVLSTPIYEYEALLTDYGFIRCHQSHLVNKRYIASWDRDAGRCFLLEDGTEIPVSRSRTAFVEQKLGRIN